MSYNLGQIDPDERTGLYVEPPDEEFAPAARPILRILGALLVMSVFAGGLWFAYFEGARHADESGDNSAIPLIRADTQPIKVKPAEPGGMHVPDRNMLIYSEGQSRPEVEHLLPPPEEPMALPVPPPPSASPPSAPSAPAQPTAAAPPGSGPAQPASAAHPEMSTDRSPENPRLGPLVPQARPPSARPEPAPAGGLRLQLGAVRSADMARAEWDRLKRTNPDLLGHLTAVAVRADLGGKGVYYRIQTEPVADGAVAERLCGELRQRHLGCIIVR